METRLYRPVGIKSRLRYNFVMRTRNTRQNLLNAAEQIVQRDGVAKLTLDAVAQEARVSKGCVLYHFGAKHALIEGMVENLIARFEAEHARILRSEAGDAGSWLRAFVKATVAILPNATPLGRTSGAIFAATANDPALLKRLQERFRMWMHQIERSGLDPITTNIVRLAAEGLWFTELFGFAPPEGEQRNQVIARLLEMAAETPEADRR